MIQGATIHRLSNGLCVILEEAQEMQSVAIELCIPGGIILDTEGKEGLSLLLSEMTGRGAGPYDSRAFSDEFDRIGARHAESSYYDRYSYRALCMGEDTERVLELITLMICEARFPIEQMEGARELFLMDLASLADSPSSRANIEFNKLFFPSPYSRSSYGTKKGLLNTNIDDLRHTYSKLFQPEGSVLSMCGNFSTQKVLEKLEWLFHKWRGVAEKTPEMAEMPRAFSKCIKEKSAQTYLVLGFPAVPFEDPMYYAAKVINEIWSGGMFGRLFLRLREERGLCYSVHSRYSVTTEHGSFFVYAGTMPKRAQDLVDVLVRELQETASILNGEEIERAKTNLKASLLIGEESTSARASGNLSDWWYLKRVRSINEVIEGISNVGRANISEYFSSNPPGRYSLLSLGKSTVKLSDGAR